MTAYLALLRLEKLPVAFEELKLEVAFRKCLAREVDGDLAALLPSNAPKLVDEPPPFLAQAREIGARVVEEAHIGAVEPRLGLRGERELLRPVGSAREDRQVLGHGQHDLHLVQVAGVVDCRRGRRVLPAQPFPLPLDC